MHRLQHAARAFDRLFALFRMLVGVGLTFLDEIDDFLGFDVGTQLLEDRLDVLGVDGPIGGHEVVMLEQAHQEAIFSLEIVVMLVKIVFLQFRVFDSNGHKAFRRFFVNFLSLGHCELEENVSMAGICRWSKILMIASTSDKALVNGFYSKTCIGLTVRFRGTSVKYFFYEARQKLKIFNNFQHFFIFRKKIDVNKACGLARKKESAPAEMLKITGEPASPGFEEPNYWPVELPPLSNFNKKFEKITHGRERCDCNQ